MHKPYAGILLYILISLGAMGCKKPAHELPGIYKLPVVIKFDLPKKTIIEDPVLPDQDSQIRKYILEKYPEIAWINLVHYKNMKSKVAYYEYTGQIKDVNANI